MSTHTFHPDPHTDGLADDCPRCKEHAIDLDALDSSMLELLYRRLVDEQPPRSYNELVAMDNLHRCLLIARRLGLRESTK